MSQQTEYQCGIYRTTIPLFDDKNKEQVGSNKVVFFHNHSEQGAPILLLPRENRHNRWSFHERGFLILDVAYLESLQKLPIEGLYILKQHIHVGTAQVLRERSLVQVGYNSKGEGILFLAEFIENTIQFPTTGYKIKDSLFSILENVHFFVPAPHSLDEMH